MAIDLNNPPHFSTGQKRLKKAMLSYRGYGVRLRGSRKEYIQQGTDFQLDGRRPVVRGPMSNPFGFIWLFIQPLNVYQNQTLAVFPRNIDRGLVGKGSIGYSFYLEDGRVVFHWQEDSGRVPFIMKCVSVTEKIHSILLVRGGNAGDSVGNDQSSFELWVNNVRQQVQITNPGSAVAYSEPNCMVFGSQKDFEHDFVLKQFMSGYNIEAKHRDFIYNNSRGINMQMFDIYSGLSASAFKINFYVDWRQHDNGVFYANKYEENVPGLNLTGVGGKVLTPFPGFTLDDVENNFQSVSQRQVGDSFNFPVDKQFSPVLRNYIYPGCKNYYNNFPYVGPIQQYNGSNALPKEWRWFVAFQSTIGGRNPGQTENSTITSSWLEHLEMWDQTPVGNHGIYWGGQEVDMNIFDVRSAKLVALQMASAAGKVIKIQNLDYSGNYDLNQPFTSLYDPNNLKVISLNGNNIGTGLTGPPRFDDNMVSFRAHDWAGASGQFPIPPNSLRTLYCTGGQMTELPAHFNQVSDLRIYRQRLHGTLVANNANVIMLGNGGAFGYFDQQNGNTDAPYTDVIDIDLRNGVTGLYTLFVDSCKVRNIYFHSNGSQQFISSFDAGWNPELNFPEGFPASVLFTGSFSVDHCTGPGAAQRVYPFGTRIQATLIGMNEMYMDYDYLLANVDTWIDNYDQYYGAQQKNGLFFLSDNSPLTNYNRPDRFTKIRQIVRDYNWYIGCDNVYDSTSFFVCMTAQRQAYNYSNRVIFTSHFGVYHGSPGDYIDMTNSGVYDGRWKVISHSNSLYVDEEYSLVNNDSWWMLERADGGNSTFQGQATGVAYLRCNGENGRNGTFGEPVQIQGPVPDQA